MKDRGPLLAAGILAVVLVGLFLIGGGSNHRPLDPGSHDPAGTSALVRLLRDMGTDVDLDVRELDGDTDVALMLWDQLSSRERSHLRTWVREGGVLVLTDPASPLAPAGGIPFYEQDLTETGEDPEPIRLEADDCTISPFTEQDLSDLDVWGIPVMYDVGSKDDSCFGDDETAYVVDTPLGDGHIVAFGGSGTVINETLDEADNAAAIAGLLSPHEGINSAFISLREGRSTGDSGGAETVVDIIPTSAKRVILQLGVAFLVYVLWRSRRLGKPVSEPQPVKVAASEIVAATGNLLERSGSPQHAADVLRADLRRDLITRLGLPPNLPNETFVQVVSGRTQLDEARLTAAIGPGPVSTDRDLLTVATLIDIVRKEVFAHVGS